MRYIFFFIVLTTSLFARSQELKTEFVVQYAGEGSNSVYEIAADESGNVYAVGDFEKTIYFGDSSFSLTAPLFKDGFVTKTDRCGKVLWAKHYSGVSQVMPEAIKIDSKGFVFIVGTFSGTTDFEPGTGNNILEPNGGHAFFVAKHNQAGDLIWVKRLGGSSGMYSPDFGIDSDDNLYISGSFTYTVDFDPGAAEYNLSANGIDAFVVKLNADGEFLWAKQFTGNGTLYHRANAVDKDGNSYITGRFSGEVDFDPSQNEFKLATGDFGFNIFITKLNKNGDLVWAKKFEVQIFHNIDIEVDPNQNVYFTSNFKGIVNLDPNHIFTSNGGYDVLVAKLNAAGNINWAKSFGGQGDDYGLSLHIDTLGNVSSTGLFSGTVDFDPDNAVFELAAGTGRGQYISMLNNNGDFMWAGANSSNGQTLGHSLIVTEFGIYSAGGFAGTTDFQIGNDTIEYTAVSQSDGFIQKIGTNQNRNLIQNKELFICKGQEVKLTPNTTKYDEFLWSTNETTPAITVTQKGLYYLEVKNCNQTFYDTVQVKYFSEEECTPYLYIPNAFSPNGDGLNDEFHVSGQRLANFSVKIFNRWGELIYQSNTFDFRWDGAHNGTPSPSGIYTVIVQYATEVKPTNILQQKSTLHLIR